VFEQLDVILLLGCCHTPFLPTGFSRVSARKTGQPELGKHDPTKARHIKYPQEEGPGRIFQGLTKFD
jgi:hypothetical protein